MAVQNREADIVPLKKSNVEKSGKRELNFKSDFFQFYIPCSN